MRQSVPLEFELLVATAREKASKDHMAKIARALRWNIDPDRYLLLTLLNLTYPVAMNCLTDPALSSDTVVLNAMRTRLKKLVYMKWAPKLTRLRLLQDRLSSDLSTNGINHIFLRGLEVARTYYVNSNLRVSSDIDILIEVQSLPLILEYLLSSGFRYRRNPTYRDALAKYIGQLEMIDEKTQIPLDINWRLTGNGRIGPISLCVDWLWEGARLSEGHKYSLRDEDTFLHLIQHVGQGHDYASGVLRCCTDVDRILKTTAGRLDWQYICKHSAVAEMQTTLRRFAYFYNYVFDPDPEQLFPLRIVTSGWDRAFARVVLLPGMSSPPRSRSRYTRVKTLLTAVVVRCWNSSEFSGLARQLNMALTPTAEEIELLFEESGPSLHSLRRMLFILIALVVVPLQCIGYALWIMERWLGKKHFE